MVRVSPHLMRPEHFRVYAELFHDAVGAGHRVVFSAPPQHGKTEITLHAIAWLILRYPDRRHAYVTYSQDRARSVARKVRRIIVAAGHQTDGTLDMMTFPSLHERGQCKFTSIDGGITGEPVDGVAVIDDPIKNRKEADSARRREVIEEAHREAIMTRVHEHASVFVLATRWHPQDLSGALIAEGWRAINLPALAEENDPNGREVGGALFPALWPIDALEQKRRDVLEFTWAALYQGRPRPKGGVIFKEPTYYSSLPDTYSGAYGVDLAYTSKARADWSVCVELWRHNRPGALPLYYVVRVDRAQTEAPVFAATLQSRHNERKGWPMLWRASGTEKGAAQFMQSSGIPIEVQSPPGDKLVSATPAAAAWNDGRVLVPDVSAFPDTARWLDAFLTTVANFTGTGKEHDDDVDALGNAFTALSQSTLVDAMAAVAARGGRLFA